MPIPQPSGVFAAQTLPTLSIAVDNPATCAQRYTGTVLGVSTTPVSVGSLLGMGIVTGQTKWKPVLGVLASWVITPPCAAALAGGAYILQKRLSGL